MMKPEPWFAWKPVRLVGGRHAWLRTVYRWDAKFGDGYRYLDPINAIQALKLDFTDHDPRKLVATKRLEVFVIPALAMRYPSAGDWQFRPDGTLEIYVADMADAISENAVALHEAVEAWLCQESGVTEQSVCDHDVKFEREREAGDHTKEAEPGDHPEAPYRRQHYLATKIERIFIEAIGADWEEHNDICIK